MKIIVPFDEELMTFNSDQTLPIPTENEYGISFRNILQHMAIDNSESSIGDMVSYVTEELLDKHLNGLEDEEIVWEFSTEIANETDYVCRFAINTLREKLSQVGLVLTPDTYYAEWISKDCLLLETNE